MAKFPEYFHFRVLSGLTKIEIQDVSDHDFVEVVRCRDCVNRFMTPNGWHCPYVEWAIDDDDFCSHGMNKEG